MQEAKARLSAVIEPRREGLTLWIDGLAERDFSDRVLGLNLNIAKIWASLSAIRTRPPIDIFLAATAIDRDLTLITRNVADFRDVPVKLLHPWKAERRETIVGG